MLASCASCEGFVPAQASACPHCGASATAPERSKGKGVAVVTGLVALAAGSTMAVTLMACYGLPVCDPDMDRDHDGYCAAEDCNDSDPNIHKYAEDPAGDGIDQNCDGVDGVAEEDAGTEDVTESCLTCAQGLATVGTTQSEVCLGAAATAFQAIHTCGCDAASPCNAVCKDNWCQAGVATTDCQTCIDMNCSTQKLDCMEN